MDKILETNYGFDFSKLSLGSPQSIQGGSYFTKLSYEGNDVYIQFPKCKTKQGITQTEKKYQCDLLYETSTDGELNEWLETLEITCQKLIYHKREVWFNTELELNDIENTFSNCARLYKSGRNFLIRCHINKPINGRQNGCNVYDEDESVLSFSDIDNVKDIIPLLKLEGIKFSSKNFQIEFSIVQMMILKERQEIKQCLIKINNKTETSSKKTLHNVSNHLERNKQNDKPKEEKLDLSFYKKEEGSSENDNSEEEISDSEDSTESLEDFEEIKDKEKDKDKDKDKQQEHETKKPIQQNIQQNIQPFNSHQLKNLEKVEKNKIQPIENTLDKNIKSDNNELEIVDFNFSNITETIKIKNPNEVYYEIYKAAREKAKLAKKLAMEAYLEAQNIKTKFMLDDLDESDEDEIKP
jgi:hypothetical protein